MQQANHASLVKVERDTDRFRLFTNSRPKLPDGFKATIVPTPVRVLTGKRVRDYDAFKDDFI